MDFILENYLIIILVGLFFVFALIGYLVDLLRKDNQPKENIPKDIQSIQTEKLNEEKIIEDNLNKEKLEEENKVLDVYEKNE